jgi:hypothetical protein
MRAKMVLGIVLLAVLGTALAVLAGPTVGAAAPSQFSVNTATITSNPKSTDQFVISGAFSGLSLSGGGQVVFGAGWFSQEIPFSQFTPQGQKYVYTGTAGEPGLAQLVLDVGQGQFTAIGANLELGDLGNPLTVRLAAGAFQHCTMIHLQQAGAQWTFNASSDSQHACQMPQAPQAAPRGLFVGQPTNVRVQVKVEPSAQLNANSVQFFRVDGSLNPVGAPLCTLLDNGDPANGDTTSADNVYSGIALMQEAGAGKVRLIVRAELNGTPVFSPSFALNVVKPLTKTQKSQAVNGQKKSVMLWEAKKAQFGDTLKARREAVKAIKQLKGVKNSGISKDKTTLWIQYTSGINGLVLTSEINLGGARAPSMESSLQDPAEPPAITSDPGAVECPAESAMATGTDQAIGNCRVLIYSNEAFGSFQLSGLLAELYRNAIVGGQPYQVVEVDGKKAKLAPLRTLTNYGTVIVLSGGGLDQAGNPFWLTLEPATLQSLADKAILLDLLSGCLYMVGGSEFGSSRVWSYYAVRPAFFSTLEGEFKDSVVFIGGSYGAMGTMPDAFFSKGAKAFFGYSGEVSMGFGRDSALRLFNGLVAKVLNTGGAFAAVKPKSDPVNGGFLTPKGSKRLAYGCLDLSNYKFLDYISGWLTAHFYKSGPPPRETDGEINFGFNTNSFGTATGKWDNRLYTAKWDFYTPSGVHEFGNATIQVNPLGDRVASFSADWTSMFSQAGRTGRFRTRLTGGDMPLLNYGDVLLLDASQSLTCEYINGFAYSGVITPVEHDSNVTVLSYGCNPHSSVKIRLTTTPTLPQ